MLEPFRYGKLMTDEEMEKEREARRKAHECAEAFRPLVDAITKTPPAKQEDRPPDLIEFFKETFREAFGERSKP